MPPEYARSVLGQDPAPDDLDPEDDPNRIATVKHYRSLIPLGQDARKPIFELTAADGAIGSHSVAAREAFGDFKALTLEILRRMEVGSMPGRWMVPRRWEAGIPVGA